MELHRFLTALPAIVALTQFTDSTLAAATRGARSIPAPALESEFRHPSAEKVELGRMLFFDKELSGNRNISCATCHSPVLATVDHLSINIGTGGQGLGPLRNAGDFPPTPRDPQSRGSRNMTPLFNLGHEQFRKLFWDGRVQVDPSLPQGFATPAGADLPFGFEFALDALSIFAETDLQEMTGQPGTNELADASLIHPQIGVWDGLVLRLAAIPEYVDLFTAAFPEVANDPTNITIVQAGKAIGAAIEIDLPQLSDQDVAYLLDFLEALTDFAAEDGRKTVPTRVPSGLPLAEINQDKLQID